MIIVRSSSDASSRRVGSRLVFKEWAHNNVPGKKGFQPTTKTSSTLHEIVEQATEDLWREGDLQGAFEEGADEIGFVVKADGSRLSLIADNAASADPYGNKGMSLDSSRASEIVGGVAIHTHPGDGMSSFSSQDVATTLAHGMKECRAVTHDRVFIVENPFTGTPNLPLANQVWRELQEQILFLDLTVNWGLGEVIVPKGYTRAEVVDAMWHQAVGWVLGKHNIPYRAESFVGPETRDEDLWKAGVRP